jgi:hypothetical protein
MFLAVGGGFVAAGLYLLITHLLNKGSPPYDDWPDWVEQCSVGLFLAIVGAILVAASVV